MLLEKFPDLQQLDPKDQAQLATELWDRSLDNVVELHPLVLAAIEDRIAYNNAHPDEVSTTEEFKLRFEELKKRIAARSAHA